MILSERIPAHTDIATSLSMLSDRELARLVAEGKPFGTGIGGRSTLVEVDGRPVFVKHVRLTDLELHPDHRQSTANLFELPPYFHYGIGTPGLGAWRELAVHRMTTNWVLSGRFPGFPLLHHWRVLPDAPGPLPDELADVEGSVAYWGGISQVRDRLEALRTATASLTLFLEYVPCTLDDWFRARLATDEVDRACDFVVRALETVTGFLHEQRMLHLDLHFGNILTDGTQVYLTDFGLSLSHRFRLTSQERAFLARHRGYDRAYTVTHLVNWLVVMLYGYELEERRAFVRACAEGDRPDGIPPAAAALLVRHAPLAVRLNDFHDRLRTESRLTPYPHDMLEGAYSSSTLRA
ncbi:protein kinase family protein [Streptomyces sp. NPDC052043]|uniref:protein kinase family protein n=1 Tax=Streptomyces sp. NPDC052043 TaxID=3365684 RepID=UPI0037CF2931